MATAHSSDLRAGPASGGLPWLLGGGALALLGLRRGGPLGVGLALAGGALAFGAAARVAPPGRDAVRAGVEGLRRVLPAGTVKVRRFVTIGKPRAEVWRVVRDFAGFPRWAAHVESVTELGGGRSRWVVRGPAGARLGWDSEIVAETEGEKVSWRSAEGADIRHAGVLALKEAPGGRGTEVELHLAYDAPAGALGEAVARLMGEEPALQARQDLRRLKQLLETGEVATNAMRAEDAGRRERF
jgi:uncharacterized membrane protein